MNFEDLSTCDSDQALLAIYRSLCGALLGMESHGYFSDAEWRLINKIRALESLIH